MEILNKFAELKKLYPDDIERIEADERKLTELLEAQDYYTHPGTQKLVVTCRDAIKTARLKLASDPRITPEVHRELWALIEARQWFLTLVSKDYAAELAQIGGQLDADLERDV